MAIKDLPLVRNKKLKHKICHFVLRLCKGIGTDSYKPYNENLWQHLEISSVLLFNKVSASTQMMETFSTNRDRNVFEPHWCGEANHDFVWLLYRVLTVF